MTAASRKARGAATQRIVTEYLSNHGWPFATDAGAGRSGKDILNTPGLSIEVKARRDLNLTAWLRQSHTAAANGDIPFVIHRPDGYGPTSIGIWPVTFRLDDAVTVLHLAGFDGLGEGHHPQTAGR